MKFFSFFAKKESGGDADKKHRVFDGLKPKGTCSHSVAALFRKAGQGAALAAA